MSIEDSVAAMAKIGSCRSPSFSPDGTRIAFVSDLGGVPQVWTIASIGGWPQLVTALDDPIDDVSWSPDGEWLAFSLAPGGGMNKQIYLIRPDGSELRRLTDGGSENNRFPRWTHDGEALTFGSNRRDPGTMDAYLVDVESGDLRLIAETGGVGSILDVSWDRASAILFRLQSRGDNDLSLVNLATREQMLITPHEGPGNFANARISPDGQTIYFSSDKDRELSAFAKVSIGADGAPGPIEVIASRDDAELEVATIDDSGSTAALIWNVAGSSELSLIDLSSFEPAPAIEVPGDIITDLAFSQDGRSLVMTVSGSASPMDIWLLSRETGRVEQITHSPHPGVDLDTLVRPSLEHFAAEDGLALTGWLYQPLPNAGSVPVVVSFHGGPESQERPAFSHYYQALLADGIAVFAPNVRGSAGSGKTFANLDNGALRKNAIKDIKACVDHLVQTGVVDPARIGIMGGSYGGYMTMAGLTEYPELFAAAGNFCGIVNFESFFAQTEPWMAAISTKEYGDPETERELLRSLSPIHKIDTVRAPTLVIHGANDTNVPVVEADQVVGALRNNEIPVEYILFPDEGHGIAKTSNRLAAAVSIVEWFTKYLAPQAPEQPD